MIRKLLIPILILAVTALVIYAILQQARPVGSINPSSPSADTALEEIPAPTDLPLEYQAAGVVGEGAIFSRTLTGVALDKRGRVYAAGDNEVKIFSAGQLIGRVTPAKPPLSLAVDAQGNVYVGQAGQVEKFSPAGQSLALIGQGVLTHAVTAVAIAGEELLAGDADYAANRGRVRRFDQAGRHLGDIGADNKIGGIVLPNGTLDFAVDAAGQIIAANPGRHQVETYARAGGKPLAAWGRYDERDPEAFCGCCNPMNVAVTPEGNIAVAEKSIARVKVYSPAGKLLAYIGPENFDQRSRGIPLAIDPAGRIYAADTAALTIRLFDPKR